MCGEKRCGNVLKKLGLVQHQPENRHNTGQVTEVTKIFHATQKKGSSVYEETVTDGR